MTQFSYVSAAQQVIFGAGSLNQLAQAVDQFGWRRLMLCTIPRFSASGLAERLAKILGGRLVASYAQALPHVPQSQVEMATARAAESGVEAIIGLGGGSPIGLAKAVSLALETQLSGRPARAQFPTDQPLVPVVAIPTTYAGSEMTPIYGVTQETEGSTRKVTVSDAKVTPKLTLYDPELTLPLPPQMTAASGINALAHCIEATYSISRNPLATAAALQGIDLIRQSLSQAVSDGQDIEARTTLMTGAYLAATAVATAKIGLHHGLCHVLGGTAGVAHGIAHSIMLPHAMRFNADEMAAELAAVARAMGETGDADEDLAEAGVRAVSDLIGRIGLPQRLRDVGVSESDLPYLAQLALRSQAVKNNPKAVGDAAQIETIFRAAW